jgi:hypothetical protein
MKTKTNLKAGGTLLAVNVSDNNVAILNVGFVKQVRD